MKNTNLRKTLLPNFKKQFLVFNLFFLLSLSNQLIWGQTKPPNFVFIMTDQQRYDAISFAGLNNVLSTPNIDRIATDGVYFKNAYTQCAVCAPARATILTGRSVQNTKMIGNEPSYDTPESGVMTMKTFDEILVENGYEAEYYGKWHSPLHRSRAYNNMVTPTRSFGDTVSLGKAYRDNYLNAAFPYYSPAGDQFEDTYTKRAYDPDPIDLRYQEKLNGDPISTSLSQADIHGVTDIPAADHIPQWEAGHTIDAIGRLKDKPFSITCSFHHPHPPFLATKEYISKYKPADMPLPDNWTDDLTGSPYERYKADARYSNPSLLKHFVAEYYALVKEVDDQIGLILDKLDELNLTDNTFVIFTSDHGEMLGSHSLVSKNNFYEESSHIPLMMKFPGRITPGTTVETVVSQIDLFATILDYMGMDPVHSDGKSLRGKIEGTENVDGNYIVTEWLHSNANKPSHMILKDGWKYMRPSPLNNIKALYNLNNDPLELTNLIANASGETTYANKIAELENCYQEWINSLNDPVECVFPYSASDISASKQTLNWSSGIIDITCISGVKISMDLEGLTPATLDPSDYLNVYYKVDGGTKQVISENSNGFAKKSISKSGISGSSLELLIEIANTAGDEIYNVTNILIESEGDATSYNLVVNGGTGSGDYFTAESVSIKANVAPAGKTFDAWKINSGSPEITNINSSSTTLKLGAGAANITATYKDLGEEVYLDDCDILGAWKTNNTNAISLSANAKQGTNCLEMTGSASNEFKKVISPVYNSGLTTENAVLKFWYYVSDVSLIGDKAIAELGSGGIPDTLEYNWAIPSSELQNGWNEISLNLSETGATGGGADLNAINWFRLYNSGKTGIVTTRLDAVQLFDKEVGPYNPDSNPDPNLVSNWEYTYLKAKARVKIYPNPLNGDLLFIDLINFDNMGAVDIVISNLVGQTVYQNHIFNENHHRINTSVLPKNSICFVSIKSEQSIITKRLIIK